MKNLHKLIVLAIVFSPCLVLPACQATSAASSSVMIETIEETEAAVCADLRPEPISPDEFDALPIWAQNWMVRGAVAWQTRCK